jgi:sugar phosphate isomerase/epimerase
MALSAPPPLQSGLGFSPDCFVVSRPPRTPLEYLEKSVAAGAGGAQAYFDPESMEPESLKKLRQRVEELGAFLEITTRLPAGDPAEFEAVIKAAKEAGAGCLRAVCLGGRRYETFNDLDAWKSFVADSKARIARVAPLLEKHKFALGVENHKDWIMEEMVPLLKSYSSEYLGSCIDFGNNMSLLEDSMDVVQALAPFVVCTSIKDMAVDEYEDGFLLQEVALGEGVLDIRKAVGILRQARPKVRITIDMLTRDPLKVPCLTDKYWVTFPERNGRVLARMLSFVRKHKPSRPLVMISQLDRESQLKAEMENLRRSVIFARDQLGLKG